jgi:2-phosphoglycerate kinase
MTGRNPDLLSSSEFVVCLGDSELHKSRFVERCLTLLRQWKQAKFQWFQN